MNFLNEWGTVINMVPNVMEIPIDSDVGKVAFFGCHSNECRRVAAESTKMT